MADLIYAISTSLDGYIADESGNFDWAHTYRRTCTLSSTTSSDRSAPSYAAVACTRR